ncbi:type II toxin-antitoxin system RelE/ParE family toxin [Chroococcus sp. FPU101]|uniref:type II toxin-antitoxin system RelE/ParE family toxin n=1 Tax=Chroococcus sp. FPU101 TaxID=1974212 RepID=UPI001A8F4B30|nr:type II toxin-antitoxin system RelE/ParE family toxin [Chroococcus sp. FPU101]GFE70976.1 hypothetical protein CFPU101_35860 [Chroococcus sp. FPU101]
MTLRILITPKASQDLDDLFYYIAQNNPDAALRFFDATRKTITKLAQIPSMGSLYSVRNSRLEGLRKWSIKGFENYLIFYLTSEDLLIVVRIIHSSRDLPTILEQEKL